MEQPLDRDLLCEVRRFVRERQNNLANASTSSEVLEPLNDIAELFLRGSLQPGKVSLDKRPVLKAEFVRNHFLRFAEFILSSPVIGFYSSFNEEQKRDLFDVFFLRGPSHDSLLVLGDALSKQTTNLKNAKVVIVCSRSSVLKEDWLTCLWNSVGYQGLWQVRL
ncbi:TEL2, telomere maintenance protein 2 [Desmophyllum pertusum]|uniref:TEL2, telomere maintenance protein 2 n=1 Tax=Desmophyllum pertusum TaxID=174260 RepID=A0A9X0A0P5_9CNID|nr:TEL2, telomere maintenance protein 2 [Desmophyllum pertusum]